MNKGDLVKNVATRLEVSKDFAGDVVGVVLDEIALSLCRDECLRIPGFGMFRNRRYTKRTTRNPQTGQPVEIAARLNPEWRSSPALKGKVCLANGYGELAHKWSRG